MEKIYLDFILYHWVGFGALAVAHYLAVLGWFCYGYINDSIPSYGKNGAPWLRWLNDGDLTDSFLLVLLVSFLGVMVLGVAWPLSWPTLFVFSMVRMLRYIVRLKKRVDKYHAGDE